MNVKLSVLVYNCTIEGEGVRSISCALRYGHILTHRLGTTLRLFYIVIEGSVNAIIYSEKSSA